MKLGYNTKAKDPTYYIQLGIRNGKKTTTKNIATIGKHSELLAITDDPLAYAKAQVAKYNEAMEEKNQVSMEVLLDFSEKVKSSEKVVSESTRKAVGYFYLAHLYRKLEIQQFFQEKTKDRKFTFSPDLVNRFLTYARILDPDSKLGSLEKMNHFLKNRISIISIFCAPWISWLKTMMITSHIFFTPATKSSNAIPQSATMTAPTTTVKPNLRTKTTRTRLPEKF